MTRLCGALQLSNMRLARFEALQTEGDYLKEMCEARDILPQRKRREEGERKGVLRRGSSPLVGMSRT